MTSNLVATLRQYADLVKDPHWRNSAESVLCRDAANEIDRLTVELEHFKAWGIIEVAIRNPSVAEYMRHWEGRTEKAEAEIERLTAELKDKEDRNALMVEDCMRTRASLLCPVCGPEAKWRCDTCDSTPRPAHETAGCQEEEK